MKKLIILLIAIFVNYYDSIGQASYNTVTNYHMCDVAPELNDDCPSFNGIPNNWERSHGTPQFYPSYIFMWARRNEGEGIFQNSVFPATSHYKIQIGIKNYKKIGDSKILVLATSGLSQHSKPDCGEPAPNAPNTQWIATYTGPSVTNYNWVATIDYYNVFPTTHQILIYPQLETNGAPLPGGGYDGKQAELEIDYVVVCDVGSTTYSCGNIPSGVTSKRAFDIGSSFPGGCNMVNNIAGTPTYLNAGQYIDFENNTTLTVSTGSYFVAQIVPGTEDCQSVFGLFNKPCNGPAGKTTIEENNLSKNNATESELYFSKKNSILNSKISIHPNPTTGQLNITMPAQGDYDVKITNMLGVVVYQGKLKDEQQKQIELESSLPSGNYTVQITGKEVNHIEKIILTR
ncbi:MAG: T9SS type A sorting domain-containing protein [Chitinophagales bacterium]|nr:T9SS type A sorting domain-containing protein [Chitinophagales bacterium]